MAFVRLWQFRAAVGRTPEFERAYCANGDWARLFQQGKGYLGTELLRPASPGSGYVTIDPWRTAADWQAFLQEHGWAYRELGRKLAPLCTENAELGNFTV